MNRSEFSNKGNSSSKNLQRKIAFFVMPTLLKTSKPTGRTGIEHYNLLKFKPIDITWSYSNLYPYPFPWGNSPQQSWCLCDLNTQAEKETSLCPLICTYSCERTHWVSLQSNKRRKTFHIYNAKGQRGGEEGMEDKNLSSMPFWALTGLFMPTFCFLFCL